MTRRAKPTRPLTCHRCGSRAVRVSESQQFRTVAGRSRLHADCRCSRCGHQFWSRHWQALKLSREADEAAKKNVA